jgi:hypothetical protein
MCLQPIVWFSSQIKETQNGSGVYVAKPPKPSVEGHWVGYYVKLIFEADVPTTGWFGKDLKSVTDPNVYAKVK